MTTSSFPAHNPSGRDVRDSAESGYRLAMQVVAITAEGATTVTTPPYGHVVGHHDVMRIRLQGVLGVGDQHPVTLDTVAALGATVNALLEQLRHRAPGAALPDHLRLLYPSETDGEAPR